MSKLPEGYKIEADFDVAHGESFLVYYKGTLQIEVRLKEDAEKWCFYDCCLRDQEKRWWDEAIFKKVKKT
tara:strand:+ start:1394 stop:1603 length:210 start_codon:yes stop_codon:yes gene_type:complete